ncbi:hypothetical protein AVDCRST_MAG94-3019 [uncultured Leptolyngbya sp.]|uniref:Uncharacterized protein n=1 Tax=uncultured Leptolyngbya sp. TaxID=332963 RepID=A0A6J4MBE1_9CYAN|nr:hypothetical protein AVDCRST_MAG94-3019 [uncultured Leptolyngbya sp.]
MDASAPGCRHIDVLANGSLEPNYLTIDEHSYLVEMPFIPVERPYRKKLA